MLASARIAFELHKELLKKHALMSGLLIDDHQPAHERVLFEKFLVQLKGNPGGSQQSLFPQTVNFSPADFALVMEMETEIKALGFRFEVFGKNTLLVSGIPAETAGNEKELFEGFIEQFKRNQAVLAIPVKENLARSLAKRAAIKTGQKLGKEEMEALMSGLFSCTTPNRFWPKKTITLMIIRFLTRGVSLNIRNIG